MLNVGVFEERVRFADNVPINVAIHTMVPVLRYGVFSLLNDFFKNHC